MDQFTAHLDRGWDLVQRGDTRAAEVSARKALEIDQNSPEVYNLLGYVAALEGKSQEAIGFYGQAVALDETYLEAMLNAAEVYIHPLGQYDEAIKLCEQSLPLAETDEETIDALLLMFDATLAKGDADAARSVVSRLPAGPYENINHTFLVGRAFYEIGVAERAASLIEEAAKRNPMHAESWYYLGLIHDEQGEVHRATDCFLRARELDLAEPSFPWSAPRESFIRVIQSAVAGLDPVFGQYVRDAEVFISEMPGIELVADGVDPRALVLLDGVAGPDEPGPPCRRLFVYQRNVERVAGCAERIEQDVREAIEREVMAVFMGGAAPQDQPRSIN